jgi:hypothetical protein
VAQNKINRHHNFFETVSPGFQKGGLLSPFLSLFKEKDRESQRDGFFGSLGFIS